MPTIKRTTLLLACIFIQLICSQCSLEKRFGTWVQRNIRSAIHERLDWGDSVQYVIYVQGSFCKDCITQLIDRNNWDTNRLMIVYGERNNVLLRRYHLANLESLGLHGYTIGFVRPVMESIRTPIVYAMEQHKFIYYDTLSDYAFVLPPGF